MDVSMVKGRGCQLINSILGLRRRGGEARGGDGRGDEAKRGEKRGKGILTVVGNGSRQSALVFHRRSEPYDFVVVNW